MLIDEKIDQLQNLINRKITCEELAPILGLGTGQAVRNRKNRNVPLKQFEINKIDEAFKNEIINNTKCNKFTPESNITGDYYPDVFGSCGGGAFVLSEKRERINIPQSCFLEPISKVHEYSVINAVGNSMTPYINDKDRLIVQHLKTGEQIKDNRVYVFCYNNEIYVKRLSKNVNQLIIESDNKNYDTIKLQKDEMNDIIIIGQIVGLMRDCR